VRRKRRTSQGTWLPTLGDLLNNDPENGVARSGRSLSLGIGVGTTVAFSTGVVSLTTDRPRQDPTEADSLADVIGSEWFLKRIVGSCFVSRRGVVASNTFPEPKSDTAAPILVGCGFFVARCDPAAPDSPIGFSETDGEEVSYNPLNERNIREPWIWRRTWILGLYPGNILRDGTATVTGVQDSREAYLNGFPPSNALYGSVADGPKIDAKTKRRISNDDRLFFAASICRAGFDAPNDTSGAFADIYLDYRLFGQNRRARNRGVF